MSGCHNYNLQLTFKARVQNCFYIYITCMHGGDVVGFGPLKKARVYREGDVWHKTLDGGSFTMFLQHDRQFINEVSTDLTTANNSVRQG